MGGLIQLVAYGEQDVILTGNPTVTFFQAVYKRHTNFAMETIQQTTNGSSVTNNARMTVVIARNGDLIGEMYLELKLTSTPGSNVITGLNSNSYGVWDGTSWMAERAITDIELSIGGQKIDKHYQRWWRLYSELYLDETKKTQYGKLTSLPNLTGTSVYLPLLFFFNRNPGLYLPLIALQYHEVKLDFDISPDFTTYFKPEVFNVWGNYVYLDTEERRMFAQKGHEYLIEQLQYTGASALSATVGNVNLSRITYNHPVKELVWCITQNSSGGKQMWDFTSNASTISKIILTTNPNNVSNNMATLPIGYVTGCPMQAVNVQTPSLLTSQWCEDGTQASCGPLDNFKLIINGQDRMKAQTGKYFNQMQPYYHHTGNPYPGIYSYSFALKPEQHQPSGTCNFSRVDNSQVAVVLKSGINANSYLEMFAVNYNVLRIQSGMGGLAFSN
jgi:hypothetical protein